MGMVRGIASMGKTQGGMRAVTEGIARMEKAVDASWWLSGGIDPATVAGVWQPKGAASLDASYLRLAGDEGYADIDPAVVGGVAPTWDAVNGWVFNGANQYLKSGVVPVMKVSTVIFRFTTSNTVSLGTTSGGVGTNQYFGFEPTSGKVYYESVGYKLSSNIGGSGTLAIAGLNGYLNGTFDGAIPDTAFITHTSDIFFGGQSTYTGGVVRYAAYKIQAIAIYKSTITPAQVALVSTAMAAL